MPSWRFYTGQSRDEIRGHGWLNALHPEDQESTGGAWSHAVASTSPFESEYRLRRHDGVYRTFFSRAVPVFEVDGSVREWVGFCTDISDRKCAEREAEAQRARLHSLFMEAPAIIAVTHGPDHVFELANPGYLRLVGYRDIIGKPVREAMPELEEQGYFEIQDRVYATGEAFIGKEMSAWLDRHGTGVLEEGFFNFALQPTHDTMGDVDGLMVHAVDVTEQVLARRRSERLAAERAAILGQIAEGIIIAGRDGRIIYLNDAGEEILGTQILGVPLEQHSEAYHVFRLDGNPYPAEELPLSRAILCRETVLNEPLCIHRLDGAEVIVEASATPVKADDGSQIGSVATFRDMTSQYRVSREKDEFLGAAAHDLKTPLTTIKGLAQMLHRRAARGTAHPDQLIDGLARIDATAVRMTNLINEFLDVARIQMDRPLDLALQLVDLVSLARQVAEESQEATHRHKIVVETSLPELVGQWDSERLDRVLSNLLSNAVKYSPNGGTIRVTVGVADDASTREAVLVVSDQGIGIPSVDLPRIFERFHRARNVADRIPGTGIGLAGARQIVEQHRGGISVESVEGVGTSFTVTLPLDLHKPEVEGLGSGDGRPSMRTRDVKE